MNPQKTVLRFISMNDREREDSLDLLAINEVLRGNTEAFCNIIQRYQNYIFHLSLSFLGNRNDAEDAVQEIFLKTFRSLNSFSLSRRFHPWIYAIAVNHLKSSYRSKKRRLALNKIVHDYEHPDYPDPVETAELNDTRETVRQAVSRLPEKLKDVTVLYYLEEMKISEIVEIMEISTENVKSRLKRAREKLRVFLS